MKKTAKTVFLILMILGAVFSCLLLLPRADAELDDRSVTVAIYEEELELLAASSGLSPGQWLEQAGISLVLGSDGIGRDALGQAVFALPGCGEGLPLALIENLERNSVLLPEGYELNEREESYVKALELYPDYASREVQEIENLLFRAALDRGQRLLLLRAFSPGGESISRPEAYSAVLSNLGERLDKRGIELGESFSCLKAAPFRPLLTAGAGLFTAALWVWLLCRWEKLKKFELYLYILAACALFAGVFILPGLTQKLLMLACAAVFPCFAVMGMQKFICRERPPLLGYISGLCLLTLWSLLGALMVSALMADGEYMLGKDIFTGVKLSQAIPLLGCFAAFALPLYRSLRDKSLSRPGLWGLIAAAIILAAAAVLLTLRSGDTGGGISRLETALRNGLEYSLYARPRTKELLIAVPFSALLCLREARRQPLLLLFGALAACLESVSIINTFCHAVAPLYVSALRSLLALALGCIPGFVILAIGSWVLKKKTAV